MHKKGYNKALQEALIEGIRFINQSKRAAKCNCGPIVQDQIASKSGKKSEMGYSSDNRIETMRSNGPAKVKCVADRDTVENSSIRGCVTRSKSANTQSAKTGIIHIPDEVTHSQLKQTKTSKNARYIDQMKNEVRRSERIRVMNLS